MLIAGNNLQPDPGDVLDQDISRMMRHAEMRLIHDVMARFKEKGMKGLDKHEKVIAREVLDLEWEEKQRVKARQASRG